MKNVVKLQLVQHFAARIVAKKRKYDHVTPILKSLNWLPVKDQLYFREAVLAFKCMSGLAPGYLSDQLILRSTVSNRQTRNSQMLNIPLFRSATGQKTFHYKFRSCHKGIMVTTGRAHCLQLYVCMYVCMYVVSNHETGL